MSDGAFISWDFGSGSVKVGPHEFVPAHRWWHIFGACIECRLCVRPKRRHPTDGWFLAADWIADALLDEEDTDDE